MLGTLIMHKSASVEVQEGESFVLIGGKRVEIKVEEGNHLRLSLVETMSDREEQHSGAVAEFNNVLQQRQKDLALINADLKAIFNKLDDELHADVEDALETKARVKRVAKRRYTKEINELKSQTTISVNYRVIKTGLTAVLPPGLTLHPKFLPEPICWAPYNVPATSTVEKTTKMVEEMELVYAKKSTATGPGLKTSIPNEESKFVITARDFEGQPYCIRDDAFAVESKEAEIRSSVFNKKKGTYDVQYSASNVTSGEHFSLSVTLHGHHIHGSPFSVSTPLPLVEFSTGGNHSKDWLDAAVETMSDITRARLWVQLSDVNGVVAYKSTGVTNGKWTQNNITSPNEAQMFDDKHSNAIRLDNGDRMLIIGKKGNGFGWGGCPYGAYNIIINAGWVNSKSSSYKHPRRMIITRKASYVPGWSGPDNLILFSDSGFTQTQNGKWPTFKGTFRIYCELL